MSTPDPISPGLNLVRRGIAEILRAIAKMIEPEEKKAIAKKTSDDAKS